MLPSFNNPLNPEIREVAIAHVANGVKCAMAAFLRDRRYNLQEIVDEQKREPWRICEDIRTDANPATCRKCPTGQWHGVVEEPTASGKRYKWGCINIPGPNSSPKDWAKFDQGRRFALDPNKKSSVEIQLTASNAGRIDYTRINRKDLNLGPLTQFISGGNASDPFPSLSASAKGTNTVVVSFAMEQKIDFPDDKKVQDPKKAVTASPGQLMQIVQANRQKQATLQTPMVADDSSPSGKGKVLVFGPDQFESDCATDEAFILGKLTKPPGDRTTYVDYLGIKKLINKLLDDVERDIYTGSPELALDQLTLTSQFQLTLEASAGTYHILRIVPVVVPPTVKLSPDRTHQLKITLKGAQQTVSKDNSIDLKDLCAKALGGNGKEVDDINRYCGTPRAKHLQQVIEKLDSQKTTTSQ